MTHIVSNRSHYAAEALLLQAVDVVHRYTSAERGLSRDRAFDELLVLLDSPAASELCQLLKNAHYPSSAYRPRSWHRHFVG